jgi:hypothetical protein
VGQETLSLNSRKIEKAAAAGALAGAAINVVHADEAGGIDTVNGEADLRKIAAETAFEDELIEILIHPSYDEHAPDHVVLAVNATNQVVFRDVPTKVKRKYVEVLARMKETRYAQHRDPVSLDRATMVARSGLVYNFDVLHDPSGAKGMAWIRAILLEKVND